ncbi:MAG: dockerin type I domain-containing protein [Clostridiales bacterium]|nr:dockerin type I domain-containing protein [Clostridiales bacterium]
MKSKKSKLLALVIAAALALTLIPAITLTASTEDEYGTQRDYVVSLIQSAGMKDALLGTNADRDALAKSLGFLDNWDYDPAAGVTAQIAAKMDAAMADAYSGLSNALSKKPLEPYFVNGMAQPIFYYGNSIYSDTTKEGVVRFVVYVESDLDTDGDGKLDLVKAVVQLPRAALEGAKFSTIYEARPYIEGTNGQTIAAAVQTAGNNFLNANPGFGHKDLYQTPAPRIPAGETTTDAMAEGANYRDWYYRYSGGSSSATITNGNGTNETEYEDLNWYDYYLVRGYAVVLSAGIGSAGSEGFSTCGSDVEINGFKAVIEWLTGDRIAYSDKTGNIEIKADWSNGNVGMTGRSYAGTTQFGLATTGVKGLKTIVPVAGIASWYEYTNGQGVATSIPYTTGLAWHCNSRLASATWSSVYDRYAGYSQLMRQEENALVGDYGPHWARRDYTVDNWYKDWGPAKIQTPILIVHGANDDNVRPKQSVMMYEAAKKAGVDVKWMWHQGHHMTPTFPRGNPNATDTNRPYSMYCGDYLYDEWLNMWFSHHLYGLDNEILELLPGVLAQDNASARWVEYDSWDSPDNLVFTNNERVSSPAMIPFSGRIYEEPEDYSEEFPIPDYDGAGGNNTAPAGETIIAYTGAEESYTTINSANGSSSWQNFLNAPTAGSTLYSLVLPEDITVKGVVQINMRAAISSLGSSANEPLRVHAKLVEVAASGRTLRYFGGNAMGSSIGVTRVTGEISWQGGGITSHNLVTFNQAATGTYREIGKGWLDLCNPQSGFESYKASRDDRIIARDNIDVFHDYTLYLQPAVHSAKEGNRLALIITTGGASPAAYTGNSAFTFTIDNEATNAVIPVELARPQEPVTIQVADVWGKPGGTVDVTYKISGNEFGFSTLDLLLPYISSIYTPLAVKPAGDLNTPFFVVNPNYKTDLMRIAFAAGENLSGDGLLFTVTYQMAAALPPTGDHLLDVEVVKIQYAAFTDAMFDVDVKIIPGTLVLGLLGDINGDGVITPEDAMILLQMFVGLIPWTPRALLLGDINGDGWVDTTDAALLLRMVVGG